MKVKKIKFDAAGFRLTGMTMELYQSRGYRRSNQVLAQFLVDTAIEAGRAVTEVHTFSLNNRGIPAEVAVDRLNKLVFQLYLMKNEGIYTEKAIQPLLNFAEDLRKALMKCISVDAEGAHCVPPVRSYDVDGFYEEA